MYIYEICMEYIWNMCGASMQYLLNMCMEYVWNKYGISMGYVISVEHVYGICME